MNVPFFDLSRQLQSVRGEVQNAIDRVLSSGVYILGEEVRAFEREFASSHGVTHAAGVGNGTDAIALALRASGCVHPGEGYEVITSAVTAGFTALGILHAGGIPVIADVLPDTLLIDPESVQRLIRPQTRALVPVHLYGQACDMQALRRIAQQNNLFLLEDACQAHGCRLPEGFVGTLGDAGAFSFYPTKNLGTYGDGGMVISKNLNLVEKVRFLRMGGLMPDGTHGAPGVNSRLDELHAALLREKLRHLELWNEERRRLAGRYYSGLRGTQARSCISSHRTASSPFEPGASHSWHLYVIRHPRREPLREFLRSRGIQTLVHYPQPLHQHAAFRSARQSDEIPVQAERACREILSLPLYPGLREEEQDWVIETLREFDRA